MGGGSPDPQPARPAGLADDLTIRGRGLGAGQGPALQANGKIRMNTTVVILAAGLGTRMRSKRAKVLHAAGGMTLIEHVVRAARAVAPPERIIVVTGHQADEVEELLAPVSVVFARQVE